MHIGCLGKYVWMAAGPESSHWLSLTIYQWKLQKVAVSRN